MFKALFFFALGALAGGYAVNYYLERGSPAGVPSERSTRAPEKNTPASWPADWRVTADEIKEDLRKKGDVVRQKTKAAGERISDARIVAVIKAKFVLDRDLSPFDIAVSVADGEVTLTGTVASEALLGRAIALALETDGVDHVIARLALKLPANNSA